MLPIQTLGLEILGDNPRGFYVFGGPEYGIKRKYIEKLAEHYKGNLVESSSALDVINMMSVKHLVPLVPSVYVVRYDEVFISQISEAIAAKVRKAKIIGTLVCIYEDSKSINKLNKFFPDNVASIEMVTKNMVSKYLKSDYPELDDRCIQLAANISDNYGHAQCICKSLSCCRLTTLNSMSDVEIATLFGKDTAYTDRELKKAIASRSFSAVMRCLSSFSDNYDSAIYAFLSVAVELDKVFDSKWVDSDLSEFAKKWTREDIYNLFMQSFAQLEFLRSVSSKPENALDYLTSLLGFKKIPSVKEMS